MSTVVSPTPLRRTAVPSSTPRYDAAREELVAQLSATPKHIPCKFFYDAEGSRLFDRICTLDEYYPTRTELGILRAHGAAMADVIGPGARVLELGSGSDMKMRVLLGALDAPSVYVPIDISASALFESAARIERDFRHLEVQPLHADYTAAVTLPRPRAPYRRTVAFFPGSTLGNFEPSAALRFLRRLRGLVGQGGLLVLGTDLKKDPRLIHAAYNDAKGVTAAFNKNILEHLNREYEGTFDASCFYHHAFYDPTASRIVMTLVSTKRQSASVAGTSFSFEEGEPIVTEYSYKFSIEDVRRLGQTTGFSLRATWTDENRLFAVHALEAL